MTGVYQAHPYSRSYFQIFIRPNCAPCQRNPLSLYPQWYPHPCSESDASGGRVLLDAGRLAETLVQNRSLSALWNINQTERKLIKFTPSVCFPCQTGWPAAFEKHIFKICQVTFNFKNWGYAYWNVCIA